jgi:MFS family permease
MIQGFVVLLPEIQATFHLSGVGVGALVTTRELASGIVSLPGGFLIDPLRRHWGLMLAVCIGGISVGSLILGLSPVYPLLLAGIAIVAISHSIWHLPASASLSYHFEQRRAMALSFHGVGGSIGDVAGPVATGSLLLVLGWQGILSVYAIAPFFLAFMAVWAFRGIGGPDTDTGAKDFDRRKEATKRLLRNRAMWGIIAVRGLRSMCLVALVTILPLYLANDLGMSPFLRGVHIGLLIAIGLIAKPMMGYLSDRVGRKQVLVPGLIWSCAISLLLAGFSEGISLTVLIALLGLFLYPDQPILTAATLEIVGREVATTALGIVAFFSFLMAAVSPLIAAPLYGALGLDAALYYVAALFAAAAIILALVPLTSKAASPLQD